MLRLEHRQRASLVTDRDQQDKARMNTPSLGCKMIAAFFLLRITKCSSSTQWSARLVGADCLQVARSTVAKEASATTDSSKENLAVEVCFMPASFACSTCDLI